MQIAEYELTIAPNFDGVLTTRGPNGFTSFTVGHMGDNRSTNLTFERPAGFETLDLSVVLSAEEGVHVAALGQGNELLLERPYTMSRTITATPVFTGPNGYVRQASPLTLRLPQGAPEDPAPWPDPPVWQDLADNAWYGPYTVEGDEAVIVNSHGQELVRLPLGGGGGTSTIAWLPAASEAGLLSWTRSSSTTPPEPVNVMGPAGPRGDDGTNGQNGQDGQDGQDGAPGKSAFSYATEGGYTGGEAAFYADLAAMDGLAAEMEAF